MKINIWLVTGISSFYDIDGDETPNVRERIGASPYITKEEIISIVRNREFKKSRTREVLLKATLIETIMI